MSRSIWLLGTVNNGGRVAMLMMATAVAAVPILLDQVHLGFPPRLACLDDTSLPVSYSLIAAADDAATEARYNDSNICFTLQGMDKSWCGPLASPQTPVFEQVSPGWHQLVYWLVHPASSSSPPESNPPPARVLVPFRVSDPDDLDCEARCPQPYDNAAGLDAGVAAGTWLCPETEAHPQLYIVTPRPGRIISTDTRIPISVKVEGVSSPQDRLHFQVCATMCVEWAGGQLLHCRQHLCFPPSTESLPPSSAPPPRAYYCMQLLRDGDVQEGGGGDLLDLWTTQASPGQLVPMPAGDYRLTARLIRTTSAAEGGGGGHVVVAQAGPIRFHVRADAVAALDEGSYLREEGFRQIWVDKYWGVAGRGSGLGSTLEASHSDRQFLTHIILQHGIRRVYDAGCGSAHWQPHLLRHLHESHNWTVHWHGADIVPEVVERNRQHAATTTSSTMTFSVTDLVRDPVVSKPDMILCRHALFHNTNAAIRTIIERFNATTSARWLALTTLTYFRGGEEEEASLVGNEGGAYTMVAVEGPETHLMALNRDGVGTDGRLVAMGGYRPVDLQAPPFSLPPPTAFRRDGTCKIQAPNGEGYYVGGLGLWELPLPPWPESSEAVTSSE